MQEIDLRRLARNLFEIGVRAADPAAAVKDALAKRPLPVLSQGRHIIIAFGKAACAMAEAALQILPDDQDVTALAVTNYENERPVERCTVIAASHPTPDESGLQAGNLIMNTLLQASKNDHVLFLVSGGGSALVPAPLPGISLSEKILVNEILLSNGFDIHQTNLVRQQLSLLKGGGMARLAEPARQRSLIVSDVIGDDPLVIASGPTTGPIGKTEDAVALLNSRGVWDRLPNSVKLALSITQENLVPLPMPDAQIICSNRRSIEAIFDAGADWNPQIVSSRLSGDVRDACQSILNFVRQKSSSGRQLLIWGGETTVNVSGTGKGGRNQEMALRFAMNATDLPGDWLFLSGGTDGRDGPTDAAGAMVDACTQVRAAKAGADIRALLANSDSYGALQASGDLLMTGATGTNVADIALFISQ